MNPPISPAVLAFAAELRQWRTDTPAQQEQMAADLALLLVAGRGHQCRHRTAGTDDRIA